MSRAKQGYSPPTPPAGGLNSDPFRSAEALTALSPHIVSSFTTVYSGEVLATARVFGTCDSAYILGGSTTVFTSSGAMSDVNFMTTLRGSVKIAGVVYMVRA